ncbi:phosphopantetheine-binding protein, partial [Undibacterium sp. TS12]|uniref:phosphopantetheine-binding protein n=1 Tax=Undibacterium sp. TS12 TaxID=2908202 RepID=UPI001F4C71A3
ITLSNIWQEVLYLDQIGIEDDFFSLGGHSLAAMQVVSRIRDEFNIELALRDIFEFTTIDALARHIDSLGASISSDAIEEGVI